MYISEFACGIFATLIAEVIVIIIWCITSAIRRKRNKKVPAVRTYQPEHTKNFNNFTIALFFKKINEF